MHKNWYELCRKRYLWNRNYSCKLRLYYIHINIWFCVHIFFLLILSKIMYVYIWSFDYYLLKCEYSYVNKLFVCVIIFNCIVLYTVREFPSWCVMILKCSMVCGCHRDDSIVTPFIVEVKTCVLHSCDSTVLTSSYANVNVDKPWTFSMKIISCFVCMQRCRGDYELFCIFNVIAFCTLFSGRLFDRVDIIKPVSNVRPSVRTYVRAYVRLSVLRKFLRFQWNLASR